MTDIRKDIAWYCRTVSAFFPSATPGKRKLLRELRAQAKAFLAEHPTGGYDELVARFGSPEQVADAYIAQLDSGKLVRSIRFRRICVRWAAAALTVLLLLFGAAMGRWYRHAHISSHGYLVVTTTDEDGSVIAQETIFLDSEDS